jgi:cysteine-rich repeat protein
MTVGGVYEIVMFHAERNECGSNFKVTLKDFDKPRSVCASTCGDGVVASDELCDDGAGGNDGQYGNCGADCLSRGPHCGDGTPQTDQGEACDDGVNLSAYGTGCAPGCALPARCGDGQTNALFGEQCDDGVNDGSYGTCPPQCQLGPRCGDGELQGDEACDDGNLLSKDGCSATCTIEQIR